MNFQCPPGFNIQTFLSACIAATPSVLLEGGSGTPDGFIVYAQNILSVTLYVPDDSKQAVVISSAEAQGATPI